MSVRRLTWTAYLLMACEGYLIYAVGYITPYLQSGMGAPPWVAALPNSAMAVGLLVSGFYVDRIVRAGGPLAAIRLWIGLMVVAAVLISWAVSVLPILIGALLYGVAVAGVLVHVITALAERRDGVLLVRAFVWSVAGGLLAPLVLSTAARTVGWSFGVLAPLPLLLALAFIIPGSAARDATGPSKVDPAPLGRAYWLTWMFIALGVAAEFSFIAWGSQVASLRVGLPLADATALASLFVVGEVLGRLALSTGIAARGDVRILLGAGAALAAIGGAVLWAATVPALAGAGMFLGGLGIAAIFPVGAGLAVAQAPHVPVKASTRLTAASGIAIFSAPLMVGVVAGATGVIGAWVLVVAFLVAAVAVMQVVPAPVRTDSPAGVEPLGRTAGGS